MEAPWLIPTQVANTLHEKSKDVPGLGGVHEILVCGVVESLEIQGKSRETQAKSREIRVPLLFLLF